MSIITWRGLRRPLHLSTRRAHDEQKHVLGLTTLAFACVPIASSAQLIPRRDLIHSMAPTIATGTLKAARHEATGGGRRGVGASGSPVVDHECVSAGLAKVKSLDE